MRILVTGTAGFIGNAVALHLLERGDEVAGLDMVNDYYDVALKEGRLARIEGHPNFREARIALEDAAAVQALFADFRPRRVLHLAAQAGVRYSLEHPGAYVSSNLVGFANVLEGWRHHDVEHLVVASSSSVYGANTRTPFSTHDRVDHPVSLYAATKKSNELMAHAYSHLFRLPTTGLRYFTVYGPWGRPDMAPIKFARAMLAGEPIEVFNRGRMQRDFTYIDDVVTGTVRVLDRPAAPDPCWRAEAPDPATSAAPYRLYNIGNHQPVELTEFIATLERHLGVRARQELLPMQPGDVQSTCADVDDLARDFDFRPTTPLDAGVERFVAWYRSFYGG